MKKRKRNILSKRAIALTLAVVMLPFADYAQVAAFSGQYTEMSTDGEDILTQPPVEETSDLVEQVSEYEEIQEQSGEGQKEEELQTNIESISGNGWEKGETERNIQLYQNEEDGQILKMDTLSLTENYTLEQDMEVNHLELNGYRLSMGIYSLTVHDDVRLENGIIQQGRQLTIDGNLEILEEDTGYMHFYYMDSKLTVSGDFKYRGAKASYGFQNIYLEVGGNVEIAEDVIDGNYLLGLSLTGQQKQLVTIPESLIIGTVELNNTSGEEIYSQKPIRKQHIVQNAGSMTYEGMKGIQGYTLMEDTLLEGEVILGEGCLNLNGHQLTIRGDFIQESGEVYINGGRLIVEGDYRIQTRQELESHVSYESSCGCLLMEREGDYVLIKGDFYMNSLTMLYRQESGYADEPVRHMTNGTLELKGDMIQEAMEKKEYPLPFGGYTFEAYARPLKMHGEHKTLFSGEKQQRIIGVDNIDFSSLEIENNSSKGIYTDVYNPAVSYARKKDQDGSQCMYSYMEDGCLCFDGGTLKEDMTIRGDMILAGGILDLAGHTLTISRDLFQKGGTIYVNNGKLLVEGDYRLQDFRSIQSEEEGKQQSLTERNREYGTGTGVLRMREEKDYVLVKGSFYEQSSKKHKQELTEGTMEVRGDFQIENGFDGAGGHKVRLTGSKKQRVISNSTSEKKYAGKIYHLEIANISEDGVVFENEPVIYGTLKWGESRISGNFSICAATEFLDKNIPCDVTAIEDVAFDQDLAFLGNLTALSSIAIENSVTVEGNIKAKEINLYRGSLTCGKNLEAGFLRMEDESSYVSIEGHAVIEEGTARAGILEVKGNITFQKNFSAAGSHKLLFSGKGKQEYREGTVDSTNKIQHQASMQNVEFQNYSEEGIVAEYGIELKGELIHNGCNYTVGGVKGILGYTLKEDTVMKEDVCLLGGVLDLNGHTLTVQGDMLHAGGDIVMNGGRLNIKGDYRGQMPYKDSYTEGLGRLIMTKETDRMVIFGDAYIWPENQEYVRNLTKGTLEIKGNCSTSGNIYFEKEINLVFSGNEKQILSSKSMYSIPKFCNISFANTSKEGIVSEYDLYVNGVVTGDGEHVTAANLTIQDLNQMKCSNYSGKVTVKGASELTQDIEVGGLLVLNGETRLGHYELSAEEISLKNQLHVEKGKVYCRGNFTVESGGVLYMTEESGSMLVKGNFYVKSIKTATDCLTAGILEIRGDFYQYKNSKYNFVAKGTHTTVLGRKKLEDGSVYVPVIAFDNPGYSKFNKLILTKDVETGYVFQNNMNDIANEVIYQTEDQEAPSQVTGLSIIKRTGSSIMLSWDEAADNEQVDGYDIYRNGKKIKERVKKTTYKDTGLKTNKVYTYQVAAYDKSDNYGKLSEEAEGCVAMPEIVSITPEDNISIGGERTDFTITFRNVGNDMENQIVAAYYDKKQKEWLPVTEEPIKQKKKNAREYYAQCTLFHEKLSESGEYEISFTIIDEDGNEATEINTYILDRTLPEQVEGLTGEEKDGVITLKWKASSSQDCVGYRIYRSQIGTGAYQYMDFVEGRLNAAYTDSLTKEGESYSYMIQAEDEFGNQSVLSKDVTIEVAKDCLAPVITEYKPASGKISAKTPITIMAKDNKQVAAIRLEYKREEEDCWNAAGEKTAENGKAVFYITEEMIAEGNCCIRAVARDQAGNESQEEQFHIYTIDNQGISKIKIKDIQKSATTVRLTWENVTEEDFNYFSVEQLQEGEEYKVIARVSNKLGYDIANLSSNTEYTFRVVGYDVLGNRGEPSDLIVVRTEADVMAPVIKNIRPGNGYACKDELELSICAQDQSGVDFAVFSYWTGKESEPKEERVYAEHKNKTETITKCLDVSEFPEGDITVSFQVCDIYGNMSGLPENGVEPAVAVYVIDRTAPEKVENLHVTDSDGAVGLFWDEGKESDLLGYFIYRSEGTNGEFKRIAQISSQNSYEDQEVKPGKTYAYKVAAVDKAGNEGDFSDVVTGMVTPDETAPGILAISPEDSCLLGQKPKINVVVQDNVEIETITVEYKKKNETTAIWYKMDTVKPQCSLYCFEPEWNTEGLEEGEYEIRVRAEDTSGNKSRQAIREYFLDLTPPEKAVLTTETQSFSVGLQYTENAEEDFAYYEIYRKEVGEDDYEFLQKTTETAYTDTQIEAGRLYFYQVKAYDEVGNASLSKGIAGYGSTEDTIAPKAAFGENLKGVVGYELVFDGTLSEDNVRIKKYAWDMGDGTTLSGATVRHAYKKPGTYIVTLTVTDAAGNQGQAAGVAIISDIKEEGITKLEVKDGHGLAIPFAYVAIKKGEDDYFRTRTDQYGCVDIVEKPGSYEYEVYAQGYIPESGNIRVSNLEIFYHTVNLLRGDIFAGNLYARKLELEELVKSGVDLSKEENYHMYEYEVNLFLGEKKIPKNVKITEAVGGGAGIGGGIGGGSGSSVHKTTVDDVEVSFRVMETGGEQLAMAYVTSRQSMKWMKDMYEVTLSITNMADSSYTIKNATAKLTLQEGLSFALDENIQGASQQMKDVQGLTTESVSWVVKGDEPGEYKAEADFSGIFAPFNVPLSGSFELLNTIEVPAGKGIQICVKPEKKAYIGEYYYVQFCIENRSDRNFYNLTTDMGEYIEPAKKEEVIVKYENSDKVERYSAVGGADYYSATAGQCSQLPVLQDGDTVTLGVFQPGDVLYGTYRTMVKEQGDKDSIYYELISKFIRVLKGKNLGVQAYISPIDSHMNKSVITRRIQNTSVSPQSKPDNSSSEPAGDPVDTLTGAFIDNIGVLSIAGSTTLAMDLSYNSLLTEEKGELGYGWNHSYENKIVKEGGILNFYATPSNYASFIAEEAAKRTTYGKVINSTIYLDSEKEYFGKFIPINEELEGYYIERAQNGSYQLYTKEHQVYSFDQEGRLTGIEDEDAREITIKHEDHKKVITDKISGKKLTYTYNDDGLITQAEDSAGRTAQFAYTNDGRLKEIGFPDKTKRTFAYDEKGRLKSETSIDKDKSQNTFVENTYDEEGRVLLQYEPVSKAPTQFSYKDLETGGTKNTIIDHNGNKMTAVTDSNGNMIESVNAKGSKTQYIYDKKGNLLTQRDHYGFAVMYNYDYKGNMLSVADALENVTSYNYDEEGNLIGVSSSEGGSSLYAYNKKRQLISVTNPLGGVTTYKYNADGLLTKETVKGKGTKEYTYKKGMLYSCKDFNGNVTVYSYDAAGNISKVVEGYGQKEARTTSYTYDEMNRVLTVTGKDSGTISYTYDCNGNKTTSTDALGNTTKYTYNKAGKLSKVTDSKGQSTSYQYDDMGNVRLIKYCDNTEEEYTYDEAGNVLTYTAKDKTIHYYEYDMLNNKTEEGIQNSRTDWDGPNNVKLTYQYYPNGKIYKETYPDGQHNLYSYNTCGRLVRVTDQAGSSITYTYDVQGNVLTETNSLNEVTRYDYDAYGRLKTKTDPNGNKTCYDYDGNGNCTEITNANGLKTTLTYNALNQLIKITAHTKEGDITRSYEYNELGLVTAMTDEEGNRKTAVYDKNGNLKKVFDSKGNLIEDNEYNTLNQLVSSKDAMGYESRYQYNKSGIVKETRRCYNTAYATKAAYAYDPAGRIKEVTDEEGKTSSYSYDMRGNLTAQTDPEGHTTQYTYNDMGKILTEQTPMGNRTTYSYNASGLLKEKENANGQTVSYTYDALGRIKEQKDRLGSIRYTYDANGNILTVTDKSGTISRKYDEMNRVTECTDHKGNTVRYAYDQLGNRIEVTYPGGEIVRYTYYKNGLLKSVTDSKNRRAEYTYDANGRLTATSNANGTREERGYDKTGRLTDIRTTRGAEVVYRCHYEYDGRGNILKETGTNTEGMDSGSLRTATMEYDKDNRLISYNGKAVGYDLEGNMTYGPLNGVMTDFEYDCRNRLIRAGDTQYEYDAENNRTAATTKKYREEYLLDRESSLVQTLQAVVYEKDVWGFYNRQISRSTYIYGAGLISEEREEEKSRTETERTGAEPAEINTAGSGADKTGGTTYLQYHYDHLGSTRAVTDESGQVKARLCYGAYGELLSSNPLNLRYLYNGRYGVATDANGLYYMRARYYNVDIKRFMNRDVVAGNLTNPQSLNRYSYVQGNPINLLDPFGLSPNDDGNESFWGKWGHTILDVIGFIPVIGDIADVANAVWYFMEGDAFMGTTSLISALPGIGSMLGNGTKLVFKGTKFASKVNKVVDVAKAGAKLISHATDLTMKAVDVGYGISDLHQEIKSGSVNWKTVGGIALNTGLAVMAGYGVIKSGNSLRKALNRSGSGTVTAHTGAGIKNTGSVESAEAKVRVQEQVAGGKETELFLPDEYYQKMDDNIAKAIAARDAEVARIQTLSKTQQSNIATVVAGVDIRTGDVYVGVKNSRVYKDNATCAEDIVFRGLGGNTNANIIMTPAIRPRNNEVIPVCLRCQTKYSPNQFVKGTIFQ